MKKLLLLIALLVGQSFSAFIFESTFAEIDSVTKFGISKPYFDAYQNAPEALAITAGTPQSPTSISIREQDLVPFINHFTPTGTSLEYTGIETRVFKLSFSGSIFTNQNNHLVTVLGGRNGAPDYTTSIDRKIGTGADVGAIAGSFFLRLATGDFVDVYFDSSVNASVTITKGLYSIEAID